MQNTTRESHILLYRRDIDGLRGVAVLLVLAAHFGTRATGGYIGVDVFFVISGYLISSHILAQIDCGSFSIADFYERRIRRIFPALFVMLAVVTGVAYFQLVPTELESYTRSLLATLFSISNFLFWNEAGYFDGPSEAKPLLHTWSLGVEEQFYIFFPIFILAIRRWLPGKFKVAILTATLLSFLCACLCVRYDSAAAFFFSPFRAWELLIGTLLSQRYLPRLMGKVQRNVASFVGLLFILGSACAYNKTTLFPGLTALAPCLGAALIIAAGEAGSSVVGDLLSLRPVVFVGLISYSLYLWHWPILAFQRVSPLVAGVSLYSRSGKWWMLVASFFFAVLSWRLVERPFRNGRLRLARRPLFFATGIAAAIISFLSIDLLRAHGITPGYPAEALAIPQNTADDWNSAWRRGTCFLTPDYSFSKFNPSICLASIAGKKQYLLLGDSHAAQLYPGLVSVFPELNIMQANATFCPPFVTEPEIFSDFVPNCMKTSAYIFDEFLPHHHVDAVLLSARWEERMIPELGRTIDWLQQHGFKTIVFGPTMEYDEQVSRILVSDLRHHRPPDLNAHMLTDPLKLDHKMADFVRKQTKASYISAFEDLCAPEVATGPKESPTPFSACQVYAAPNMPMVWDTNHLTAQGATFYAGVIRDRRQLP